MGLGDIRGKDCFDVLADIMEPAMRIVSDEEAKKLFDIHKQRPEGMTAQEFGIILMRDNFPGMMKRCKNDFAQILAVLEGKTTKDYLKDLTFAKLVNDMFALMNDPIFKSFLSS